MRIGRCDSGHGSRLRQKYATNKKPRGVSGGAKFSFYYKRGNYEFGNRIQIFYCYWIWIFLFL